MLLLEPQSLRGPVPSACAQKRVNPLETVYAVCIRRDRIGLYASLLFHIASTVAAMRRASVSLARFGFVCVIMRS